MLLESKGHVKHRKVGRAYLYKAVVSRDKTRHSALKQLVHTFFDGSVEACCGRFAGFIHATNSG